MQVGELTSAAGALFLREDDCGEDDDNQSSGTGLCPSRNDTADDDDDRA